MELHFNYIFILHILVSGILILHTPLEKDPKRDKEDFASTSVDYGSYRTISKNTIQQQTSDIIAETCIIQPTTASSTGGPYKTTTALTTTTSVKQELTSYFKHLTENINTLEEEINALFQRMETESNNKTIKSFSLRKIFLSDCFCIYIFHKGKLEIFSNVNRFRQELLKCKKVNQQSEEKYVLELIQSFLCALIAVVPCTLMYSYDFRLYGYALSS